MPPEHSAEALGRIPKHEKVVMHLPEKVHVLGKLCSGGSYSAAELKNNDSTIYMT